MGALPVFFTVLNAAGSNGPPRAAGPRRRLAALAEDRADFDFERPVDGL